MELQATSSSSSSTVTSSTHTSQVSDNYSDVSEQWEELNVDNDTEDIRESTSQDDNEDNNSSSSSHSDDDHDDNNDIYIKKEIDNSNNDSGNVNTAYNVQMQHSNKTQKDVNAKLTKKPQIYGMHRDVFLTFLHAMLNFIDKHEVWELLEYVMSHAEAKHKVLICDIVCNIPDNIIISAKWKRIRYTHLLLSTLRQALHSLTSNNKNIINCKDVNKEKLIKTHKETSKSIVRSILGKIISSRANNTTHSLLYEDVAFYELCFTIMNRHFCIHDNNNNDNDVSSNNSNSSEDDDDDDDEYLSHLSLKCLLYFKHISAKELAEQIMSVKED